LVFSVCLLLVFHLGKIGEIGFIWRLEGLFERFPKAACQFALLSRSRRGRIVLRAFDQGTKARGW
jgi:hypothetical protein